MDLTFGLLSFRLNLCGNLIQVLPEIKKQAAFSNLPAE
jgi:hypothetical protein